MPRDPDAIDPDTMRLLLAARVGPSTIRALRRVFGSDGAILRAPVRRFTEIRGIGAATAEAVHDALHRADPARELEAMRAHGAGLVLRGDEDFPTALMDLPYIPEALWVRGSIPKEAPSVAIVGSRRPTRYGCEQAAEFTAGLGAAGLTIVSGGAIGIDAVAHRTALQTGAPTVAVLGCGLGVSYPRRHRDLFARIAAGGGALVSEFPMACPPRPAHFPRRNRLIAGLSRGVLVIEAARRSGALITARIAVEDHGREAMAVPGRVDSPLSEGCLRLLQEGGAALVRSPSCVLDLFDVAPIDTAQAARPQPELSELQRRIVDVVREARDGCLTEAIIERVGLDPGRVLVEITRLELNRIIRSDGPWLHLVR